VERLVLDLPLADELGSDIDVVLPYLDCVIISSVEVYAFVNQLCSPSAEVQLEGGLLLVTVRLMFCMLLLSLFAGFILC
jgi:hypothetical protein